MSLQNTNGSPVRYHVWFRHTGMEPPREGSWEQDPRLYSLDEIKRQVGGDTITHLAMKGNILPDIHLLAPHLTHVAIQFMTKEESNSNCSRFANVSKLINLEVLSMSDNDISSGSLPEIFSSMTSLRDLNLKSCQLTSLPLSVSKLIKLEVLSMSDNDFSSNGLPEIFSSMISLRELYSHHSNLTTLPMSMFKLINLELLSMSNNDFSSDGLPEIFSSMTSLRELDLTCCKLTTLPLSVSKLIKLEKLGLSYNDFSSHGLPDIFCSMTSLKQLDLNRCKLSSLPLSMSKLIKLEKLGLSNNDFSSHGLPDIFSSMTSLRVLTLNTCKLTALPSSMKHLKVLHSLDLSLNDFTSLPSCVCEMRNLATLDIGWNRSLTNLNPKILQLTQLGEFGSRFCDSLTAPPYEVHNQGLNAIRQYYTDLAKGAGQNLPFVTIAVIGNTMAGKTSLIRTLQSSDKKRVLTHRAPDALVDETTRVFNVEEVRVDDTVLRLIDMGGNDMYHVTYQLTLKQHCIPVIVVNVEQYTQISDESNRREAVRRLAFDWLSHLYLAHPDLGPPKLILTHKDKFDNFQFASAKLNFLKISDDLCKEIVEEEKPIGGDFCRIQHFSDSSTPMFLPEDIYEVGKDETYSVFDNIKLNLLQSSQSFVKPLPKIWEDVTECIMSLQTAFNPLDELVDILRETDGGIEENQLKIILRYMHDCGKVLWYEDIDTLHPYVFHKISEVTKLLCVLCNHDTDVWSQRLDYFVPYRDQDGTIVEKEDYEALVWKLLTTGVLEENLLHYLVTTETSFASDTDLQIAIALLQSFRLLHGPLHLQSLKSSFIMPYFATGYHVVHQTDNEKHLTLQVDVEFKGLALPRYVYYQMSVGLLKLFRDDKISPVVNANGAIVFHDGLDMQLTCDFKSRQVSLRVSSAARDLRKSWEMLIKTTNNMVNRVLEMWTAARPVCISFCAHCLLIKSSHPERIINPPWFMHSLTTTRQQPVTQNGSRTVVCNQDRIPSPLKFPCTSLTDREIEYLERSVALLKLKGESSSSGSQTMRERLTMAQQEKRSIASNEAENGLSDVEQEGYVGTSSKDNVYPTREGVSGKEMLLNYSEIRRPGGDVDSHNLESLFLMVPTVVEILNIIEETKLDGHKNHFALVMMSHGNVKGSILRHDDQSITLFIRKMLLSAFEFPATKDMTKLRITQACKRPPRPLQQSNSRRNSSAVPDVSADIDSLVASLQQQQQQQQKEITRLQKDLCEERLQRKKFEMQLPEERMGYELDKVRCKEDSFEEDSDDEDESALEEFLRSCAIEKEYKPIPPQLIQLIYSKCGDLKLECVVISQSTENWRHLLVAVVNPENIDLKLKEVQKDNPEFKDFEITVKNIKDPPKHESDAGDERLQVRDERLQVNQKTKNRGEIEWLLGEKTSRCELIVRTSPTNRDNKQVKFVFYAVVPAHLVMTKDQKNRASKPCSNLKDMQKEIQEAPTATQPDDGERLTVRTDLETAVIAKIRLEVEQVTSRVRHSIQIHNETEPKFVDLKYPPLFCYRQWFYQVQQAHVANLPRSGDPCPAARCPAESREVVCHHLFTNDIALLPLEEKDAVYLQEILEARVLPERRGKIFPIRSSNLQQFTEENAHTIKVNNLEGTLRPPIAEYSPDHGEGAEQGSKQSGIHLTFVLNEDTDTLEKGDCGAIVYLVSKEGVHRPIGMYVGKMILKDVPRGFHKPTYKAIVLPQAFKDLQEDYPHHITRLIPFGQR